MYLLTGMILVCGIGTIGTDCEDGGNEIFEFVVKE